VIHRHLDYDSNAPLPERGRAALDDILERGDLGDWAPLLHAIAADPHGALASTVLELAEAHEMYGTSRLWRCWIERARARATASPPGVELTLAALRAQRGLRQIDVAERLGASQSDVSRMESRGDLRVSTLRDYIAATGGRLECRAVYPDGVTLIDVPRRPPRGG
jgi:hypothetical protein